MGESKASMNGRERFLSFSLGTEEYAVPLLAVREVIAMPEYTPVPYTPPYFLGIMNLRGQVISVMDMRQKLGVKAVKSEETTVIICDLGGISIGVVVDSVNTVLSPDAGEIAPKPDIQSSRATDFITGVYRKENKLILFLDIAKSLNLEDQSAIQRNQQSGNKSAA
jgi:purine-binding chemotaxis protein CheW